MMFGSRRSWENDKGGTRKGMRKALRKEKVISLYAKDGLLLAHYEEDTVEFMKKCHSYQV